MSGCLLAGLQMEEEDPDMAEAMRRSLHDALPGSGGGGGGGGGGSSSGTHEWGPGRSLQ